MYMAVQTIKDARWSRLHLWLILLYLAIACILLIMSGAGHLRLLKEVNQTFGGFFWAIDTDGEVVIVSTPSQLPSFEVQGTFLTTNPHIIAVNNTATTPSDATALSQVYQRARSGEPITYIIATNDKSGISITRPATTFTWDMWWQSYGLGLLAGICWLVVGGILLVSAREWTGVVEGMSLLPPAILLLLYSHWGNVQQAYPADLIFQLLWVPSFALFGATLIHLSLIYRPEVLNNARRLRLMDGIPYVPLIALVSYEWGSLIISGQVPTRINLTASLGYGVLGALIGLCIGISSLVRTGRLLPQSGSDKQRRIPIQIRQRIGDMLTLWIGGIGAGICLGILPLLLMGHSLFPLPAFYIAATIYPLILLYTIRSLGRLDRLHATLEQQEEVFTEQRQAIRELQQANQELEQATSLLLRADANLRSRLSQRIHDQPRQQALRIRSLLGHWQHKLRIEAERDAEGKTVATPIVEALGKVRKISEELESDLRGLQLLVEDAYQRRNLGLKLHLEKMIREDLPALHPESPLKIQADLWALDAFTADLEQTEEGARIAEAISYTVTQTLLNIYNHAGATFATIRTTWRNDILEVAMSDDGRGFDPARIPPEKTSLLKARLKIQQLGGTLSIQSSPRSRLSRGTTVTLRLPLPQEERNTPPPAEEETDIQAMVEPDNHQTYR
jgi:signal transduction histidine kinase